MCVHTHCDVRANQYSYINFKNHLIFLTLKVRTLIVFILIIHCYVEIVLKRYMPHGCAQMHTAAHISEQGSFLDIHSLLRKI